MFAILFLFIRSYIKQIYEPEFLISSNFSAALFTALLNVTKLAISVGELLISSYSCLLSVIRSLHLFNVSSGRMLKNDDKVKEGAFVIFLHS